jgi:hypothetical protein
MSDGGLSPLFELDIASPGSILLEERELSTISIEQLSIATQSCRYRK